MKTGKDRGDWVRIGGRAYSGSDGLRKVVMGSSVASGERYESGGVGLF